MDAMLGPNSHSSPQLSSTRHRNHRRYYPGCRPLKLPLAFLLWQRSNRFCFSSLQGSTKVRWPVEHQEQTPLWSTKRFLSPRTSLSQSLSSSLDTRHVPLRSSYSRPDLDPNHCTDNLWCSCQCYCPHRQGPEWRLHWAKLQKQARRPWGTFPHSLNSYR